MIDVTTHNHGTTVTIRIVDASGPHYVTIDRNALDTLARAAGEAARGRFDDDQTVG